MDCDRFAELLDIMASLSEDEISELEKHSAHCEKCADELAFMRSVLNTAGSLPPIEPPADFLDALNARLDMELAHEPMFKRFMRKSAPYIRKYGSVAACLAVGIVIGANAEHLVSRMTDNGDGVVSTVTTKTASESQDNITASENTEPGNVTSKTESGNTASQETVPLPEATASAHTNTNVLFPKTSPKPSKTAAPQTGSGKSSRYTYNAAPSYKASSPAGTLTATSVPAADTKTTSTRNNVQPQSTPAAASAPAAVTPAAMQSTPDAAKAGTDENDIHPGRGRSVQPEEYAAAEPARIAPNVNPSQITDAPAAYSLARASDNDTYAAAEADEAAENHAEGYSMASAEPETKTASVSSLSSTIVVKSEDAARVKELVNIFVNGTYGNYYMITSNDMKTMLSQFSNEGIWYTVNINDSGDKISFKLVIA